MDSTEELQQLEMTALKSIYAEDFMECPPPKAWKGATRVPEFIIRVPHPDPAHADKISLQLHVKLPKTYPRLACPVFTIQKPTKGLASDDTTKLMHEINLEAQRSKGQEMVFQIVTLCQDWIADHITPPIEVEGSLASQMSLRAMDEERIRQEREAEVAERERLEAERVAQALNEQIQEDVMRQMLEREQNRARRRANSEATEVPLLGDTPTETFNHEVEIEGVRFHTVKLFHPRNESLGVVYMADPMCDDINTTLPLELYVVTFDSQYYASHQGRKKLKQLEGEIQRLASIRHPNLLSVFAVKLNIPHSNGPCQLLVLSEQAPALTLQDVLEDCQSLRADRTSDYLGQILNGLNALHDKGVVHRGINPRCIGLASREEPSQSKLIKIGKVGYHTKLLDLHRSNPFGPNTPNIPDDPPVPDEWLSRDVKIESSLLYTRHRDLHSVGILLLQMLIGLDVMERYSDVEDVIYSSSISPMLARQAITMLSPPGGKKNAVTCISLLADLAASSLQNIRVSSPITTRHTPIPYNFNNDPKTPINYGSPESASYFRMPVHARQTSRWKEDWDELELLGKGAFGSVVKARNKIDSRIYAVKKVRLKNDTTDKIFREVNALSKLSHRFIVRYYTTWVETSEQTSAAASDDDSSMDSETEDGMTSVPDTSERHLPVNGGFVIKMSDFDTSRSRSKSSSSFPSLTFEGSRSESPGTSGDDSSGDGDFGHLFQSSGSSDITPLATVSRTLYIQMEFVERQTLRERVDEGISEGEAWRLFQQIVDALVHMSTHGILHRDIKLTNIFIDANNDCKVGDFGLATSSLAAVDPSDVSPQAVAFDADMTLEVGTRLYIAPEVQSRKRGPRNHSKADMYSLGIVFFEMNYMFSTGAERIAVIEDLRKAGIFFPPSWDQRRARQREIITWLLQHSPNDRPTAEELSKSSLLPPRVEDEHFKDALSVMTKPDSPHHQAILSSLFNQPPRMSRSALYDIEADPPDHSSLNDTVQERLSTLFHLHGAVDMEPPLLMPVMDPEEDRNHATFIDRHGDIVSLPSDILVPFARLAARSNIKRIKRYHISNVYRPNVAGHPKAQKAAVFDIITQDLESGPLAAGAEIISIANDILNNFPNLAQNYEIHISHARIVELALNRVPTGLRDSITEILTQPKSTPSQKRALLLKKGLLRSTADELEILSETDEDLENILLKLEKIAPAFVGVLQPAVEELKETLQFAASAGVTRTLHFHPLMLGTHLKHFKDGSMLEIVRKNKHNDVLAAGGRYDRLINRFAPLKQPAEPVCAVGLQIAMEKITMTLAAFQSTSVKNLVKEERSFGFWSPRRCDVYVVSYHPGYLQERLEIVAYLWQHNISADLMYESGLPDAEHEAQVDLCAREGVLFTVYPRPRAGRRDQPPFKVKSILKGTENDLSRQELVPWLQQQIAEQKRIDLGTSGAPLLSDRPYIVPVAKDPPMLTLAQLLLPVDAKKQRKQVKQLFLDRAFETGVQIKNSMQNGMPMLAIDVPPAVFDSMVRNSSWVVEDEQWKAMINGFASPVYAQQIRDAAVKRKSEGHPFMLLFSVRDERVQLLNL